MDQRQYPPRAKGPPQTRPKDRPVGQRHPLARQSRHQPAIALAIVDPDADAVRPDVKAELIGAADRLKRRHMQNLSRRNPVFRPDRPQIIAVAKVGMPVAISVRHLGNHHAQTIVMTQPERHRVEDMPQNTRLRQQFNPHRPRQTMLGQHLPHPLRPRPQTRRATMVTVLHRGKIAPVARKQTWPDRCLRHQQHIIDAIAERIADRPFAPVKRPPPNMIDPAHAAARSRRACIA